MARVELNLTLFHTRHKVTAAGEGWRESSARLDIMTCGPNLWLGQYSQTEPMRGLCHRNMTNQRAVMISFSASQRARGSSMHSPCPPCFLSDGAGKVLDWARSGGELFLILQHTWWITSPTLTTRSTIQSCLYVQVYFNKAKQVYTHTNNICTLSISELSLLSLYWTRS